MAVRALTGFVQFIFIKGEVTPTAVCWCNYTKTDLVFVFSKNQILVAVIPGQKAPRTLLGQNSFWIIAKNHFEMSIPGDNRHA
jgi:hypothetical protein